MFFTSRLIFFLLTILFYSQQKKSPLKFKIFGRNDMCFKKDDGSIDSTICDNPLSTEIKDRIQRELNPAEMDFFFTVKGKYGGKDENGDPSMEYHSDIYDYIRTINPDIIIVEYANPRNWASNIFYKDRPEFKEEWYLHWPLNEVNINNRVCTHFSTFNTPVSDERNEHMYNMQDPGFQDYFNSQLVRALRHKNKLDGMYLDNFSVNLERGFRCRKADGVTVSLPLNPKTGNIFTIAEQEAEGLLVAQAIRDAVHNAYKSTGNWKGEKFSITFNVGQFLSDNDKEKLKILSSSSVIQAGALSEGHGWFGHGGMPWRGPYTVEEWKNHVDSCVWLMENDYQFLLIGKKMTDDVNPPTGKDDQDWYGYPSSKLMFIYGSSLLAGGRKSDKFYFQYGYWMDINWEGYNVELGYAQGDYFKWKGTNNIYARWFEKSLVLVNPSDTPETINTTRNSYRAIKDKTIQNDRWEGIGNEVTSYMITIEKYSAEIILCTPPPHVFVEDPDPDPDDDDDKIIDGFITGDLTLDLVITIFSGLMALAVLIGVLLVIIFLLFSTTSTNKTNMKSNKLMGSAVSESGSEFIQLDENDVNIDF